MAKQLVLIGNRVIAYGEDCYVVTSEGVKDMTTEKTYSSATVAEYTVDLPSDIDIVGYEYHAGEFVPCAPYGKGTGTIPVLCDDCKTLLDSGLTFDDLGLSYTTTYLGSGTGAVSITAPFVPKFAVVMPLPKGSSKHTATSVSEDNFHILFMNSNNGFSTQMVSHDSSYTKYGKLNVSVSGNTITWDADFGNSFAAACNYKKYCYQITVWG